MLSAAGLMALEDAGKVRATDTRDDEAERGILSDLHCPALFCSF